MENLLSSPHHEMSSRERANTLLLEGRQHFAEREYETARAIFKEAASLDPGRRDIWLCLASVSTGEEQAEYLRLAQDAAARKTREERLPAMPGNPDWDSDPPNRLRQRKQPRRWNGMLLICLIVIVLSIGGLVLLKRTAGGGEQVAAEPGKTLIEVSSGGRLNLEGLAGLYVPPGALFQDATFRLSYPETEPPFPEQALLVPVGKTVDVQTDAGLLRQPVWVGLRYNPADLPPGMNENSLQVARWDGSSWKILASDLYTDQKILYTAISHFSTTQLRIFGVASAAEETADTGMVQQLEEANQLYFQPDFNRDVIGRYEKIVFEVSSPAQLTEMSELEKQSYWMAFNLWGSALLKDGQYEAAGQVFEYAVQAGVATRAQTWDNHLLTSPGYALDMLQNTFPLGVKTVRQLAEEPWANAVPRELFTLDSGSYSARVTLTSEMADLPQVVQDAIREYEVVRGVKGEDKVLTSVNLLVLSPQAQNYSKQENTLQRSILPFLQFSEIDEIGAAALKNSTRTLGADIRTLLQQPRATNVYLSDPLVPEQNRHSRAPLLLLRVERAYNSVDGFTHTQHVFSLGRAYSAVGKPLGDPFAEDTSYQYSGGVIKQSPMPLTWLKMGAAETRNIKPVRIVNEQNLAAGAQHACTLGETNGVQCWGLNEFGQLGSGDFLSSSEPKEVRGLNLGFRQIAAGENHTCALSSEGKLFCWGSNDRGQIGNNTTTVQPKPVEVTGFDARVTLVTAGAQHTCAVTANETLYCWGNNTSGQLGTGTTDDALTPVQVSSLTGVKAAAAGGSHTCAVTSGQVQCWGGNDLGQLGNDSQTASSLPVTVVNLADVISVTAGQEHTCSLNSAGGVMCWGANNAGQLGSESAEQFVTIPVEVSGLQSGATAIRSAKSHTCAVVETGMLCWGANPAGQTGGSVDNQVTPAAVQISGEHFISIGTGSDFTCARTVNGLVYCWGGNQSGQLGNRSQVSSLLPSIVNGFGTVFADAVEHIEISPSIDGGIELDSTLQIRGLNLPAETKRISYQVAYNGQAFEEIASSAAEDGASWKVTGKELGKKVLIKLVAEDAQGAQTEYISDELTIQDSRLPSAAIALQPPARIIELGDTVVFTALDLSDTTNDINGSGIKELIFQVLENGVERTEPVTLPYKANEPMQITWPAPMDRKRNNTQVTFRLTVVDQAGNQFQIEDDGYSLSDRNSPTLIGELTVQANPAGLGSEMEKGADVTVTVDVSDGYQNGNQGSQILEAAFYVSTSGVNGPYRLINTHPVNDEANLLTISSDTWDSKDTDVGSWVYFKAVVKDAAGNMTEKISAGYRIGDRTKPTASAAMSGATNPITGPSASFTVSGITDGEGSGVTQAVFSATCDGKTVQGLTFAQAEVSNPGAEINNTLTLPPPSAACGWNHSIVITLTLTDGNGNANPIVLTPTLAYQYDPTAPADVAITKDGDTGIINVGEGGTVTLQVNYTNEPGGSPISKVDLSVTCPGYSQALTPDAIGATSTSFSWTPPAPTDACGWDSAFAFTAAVTDEAGKTSPPASAAYTNRLDTTDPTATLNVIQPGNPAAEPVTIEVTGIDDGPGGSGVSSAALVLGGKSFTITPPSFSMKWPVMGSTAGIQLPCGLNTVRIVVKDGNGNQLDDPKTFTYQYKTLSGSITPTGTLGSYNPVTFRATVANVCGGIQSPTFTISRAGGTPVTLAGSASASDAAVTITSTAWTPEAGYDGPYTVRLSAAGATPLTSSIQVQVNDPPVIVGQARPLTTPVNNPLTLTLASVTISDPDPGSIFTLLVMNGANYAVTGTTITPAAGFSGTLIVPVKVSDGKAESNVFNLTVTVKAPSTPIPPSPTPVTPSSTPITPSPTPVTPSPTPVTPSPTPVTPTPTPVTPTSTPVTATAPAPIVITPTEVTPEPTDVVVITNTSIPLTPTDFIVTPSVVTPTVVTTEPTDEIVITPTAVTPTPPATIEVPPTEVISSPTSVPVITPTEAIPEPTMETVIVPTVVTLEPTVETVVVPTVVTLEPTVETVIVPTVVTLEPTVETVIVPTEPAEETVDPPPVVTSEPTSEIVVTTAP